QRDRPDHRLEGCTERVDTVLRRPDRPELTQTITAHTRSSGQSPDVGNEIAAPFSRHNELDVSGV
ncbi:hypothetical protein, partial [Pseudonocardia phyllosphaerae]|uniref:hypothetical protein n=1 Tax=Pseudonocardia phyllosphaerae TaxID=3390502 RepID=UPI003979F96F